MLEARSCYKAWLFWGLITYAGRLGADRPLLEISSWRAEKICQLCYTQYRWSSRARLPTFITVNVARNLKPTGCKHSAGVASHWYWRIINREKSPGMLLVFNLLPGRVDYGAVLYCCLFISGMAA